MSDTENALLEKAVSGDQRALTKLLERDGPTVRNRMAAEIPSRWQALLTVDDVMQQTYIDAFLDVKHFDPRGVGSFQAWLTTLAKRNLLDAIRMLEAEKRGRGKVANAGAEGGEPLWGLYAAVANPRSSPSRYAARGEARSALETAIGNLPADYRTVVQLYDMEQQPVADVAAKLARSPGAVFMLRSRAHRLLREYLGTASHYLSDSR